MKTSTIITLISLVFAAYDTALLYFLWQNTSAEHAITTSYMSFVVQLIMMPLIVFGVRELNR